MIKYLFLLAIALYLLSNVITHSAVAVLLSVASLLAVVSSSWLVNKIALSFGLVFLASGGALLLYSGASLGNYIMSFGEMMNLITLFALIPILALPIKLGNYAKAVSSVIIKKIKNSGQLYMVSSGISYFLSSFMNLAALPMTYYCIRPSVDLFKIKNTDRFMSRSVSHGFAMPLLWTPVTPIVGIIIEMTGVNYVSMLHLLIPLSILGLLLDWITAHLLSKKYHVTEKPKAETVKKEEIDHAKQEISATTEVDNPSGNPRRLLHIVIGILLLNTAIAVSEYFFTYSFLFLVSVLVIPFSFMWSLFLRKSKEYFTGLKEHFQVHLIKMKDQFFLFLSAGFFISAINFSGAGHTVNVGVSNMIDVIGTQIFLVILPIIPVLLAFIGLHPAVAIVLIAESLHPELLGISSTLLTVALLGGAVPAFLLGPYNATLGIMSNIIDKSPFQISNWNISFTCSYLVLVIAFLQILYIF